MRALLLVGLFVSLPAFSCDDHKNGGVKAVQESSDQVANDQSQEAKIGQTAESDVPAERVADLEQ